MMHQFLSNNRDELTRRCRVKVSHRAGRAATEVQLANGVPLFLDQLIRTLQLEKGDTPLDSRAVSGPAGGGTAVSEVSVTAALHGKDLMAMGFSVDQVVHDYGDMCQAITDLGFERDAPFSVDEFRTLNRCIDNAIAEAVTEFSFQRDLAVAAKYSAEANEKYGFFAHELRNLIHTAALSFAALQSGQLSVSGSTGQVLARSLNLLRLLVDRSLAEVRHEAAEDRQANLFSLAEFIDDIRLAGDLAAKVRGCNFKVSSVDASLGITGQRDILYSAVWNLLQNAFKFTHVDTEVTLTAHAAADRIFIDVKDHCGGIAPEALATVFDSFSQSGQDRTGLGLGLAIARESVMANGGTLTVINTPGQGCVFTVELPRHQFTNETP
ncbi:MAG: HAMP domain-containing histidine kinase [Pseudomonadota bacterium]|nr:HAMP domain-containing histidine kinase [Pseudomonadota bacterium]